MNRPRNKIENTWAVVEVGGVWAIDILASLEPWSREGDRSECESGQDGGATHDESVDING
jgi:hypothetical protein